MFLSCGPEILRKQLPTKVLPGGIILGKIRRKYLSCGNFTYLSAKFKKILR